MNLYGIYCKQIFCYKLVTSQKKKKTNITVYTAKHKVTTNSNIMKRKNKQDHIPFASPILDNRYT